MVHTGTKYMHVHSLYTQNNALSLLDFFFGGFSEDIVRHCKTFNINAEKPKFYSSTVVYFTMADLLGNQ